MKRRPLAKMKETQTELFDDGTNPTRTIEDNCIQQELPPIDHVSRKDGKNDVVIASQERPRRVTQEVIIEAHRGDIESGPEGHSPSHGNPLNDSEYTPGQDSSDHERQDLLKHWRESPYAVGLVGTSWKRTPCKWTKLEPGLCIVGSGWLCGCAGRVGNMVVLYETTEQVVLLNGETVTRPQPILVLGPYWQVLVFMTYPLILGVSLAIAILQLRRRNTILIAIWTFMTLVLLVNLALVGCRNPGIMYRYAERPNEDWVWSDQALTFRPRHAKYASECACIIEEFDHVCPWTGTAIGKNNIRSFRVFVWLVFVMLIFDIALFAI
jgi:hypothetical protein